jgi:hypothetical protein
MKPNQINILAFAVLGDLEQIDDAQESRLSRQLRCDIRETDGRDGIHLDLTLFHTVPRAHFDVRTRPYANAAGDFPATNSLAETLGEDHSQSLHAAVLFRTEPQPGSFAGKWLRHFRFRC